MRDWQEKLWAFIESRRNTPHAWGTNDCCLFCADAIREMTGTDIATSFRGYTTQKEAQELIDSFGSLQALVESVLGPMQPAKTVRLGDMVICDSERGEACGICAGYNVAFVGEDGLEFRPLSVIKGCWHARAH